MTQQPRSRWAPVLCCLLFVTLARADDTTDTTDVWINGHWQGPKLGQQMNQEDITDLPQHVLADGRGLPAGEGNAVEGGALYAQLCASCHGSRGQGGKALELVGDRRLLATEFPDRGIAVYWPNAPTLFEYVYRSMPPEKPASLNANQVYAILAYVLELNGLLTPESSLDAATLSAVEMPNREGFRTIAR